MFNIIKTVQNYCTCELLIYYRTISAVKWQLTLS